MPARPTSSAAARRPASACSSSRTARNRTREVVVEQLRSYGIPCEVERVVTTAIATARYLGSGSAYVVGEHGLEAALRDQGIRITADDPDAVVVSIDRQFTYDKLKTACRLIHAGAKFVATNTDAFLKVEDGIVPGSGSIVAAVRTGSGREPVVIGKPEPLLYTWPSPSAGDAGRDAVVATTSPPTSAPSRPAWTAYCRHRRQFAQGSDPGAPVPTYVAENYAARRHRLSSLRNGDARKGETNGLS